MTKIEIIKLKYERLFCSLNCTWDMYRMIRKMEAEEIEKLNRKAA